ncbi:Glycosylphosphatidylinositol anchor biosynthesis protein-like protein [Emericellopsis cladophorae]|uniref:Glycosylphosphatidylinositol anchor biosynthesis protein-like protein n=1 Tax=Emericellopsis cladophorae TaxID=2686198 RepID=A0A9Q0BGP7_9HYPO|nr:Glycosylphosphatidylinositol anchor biosynthesis protein-like protein [Emericellopsis cladophorae]KAI6784206.1 Glycosylphosphatidylinositol anchor biosynthesis protein-like protein [Emericellopsis cladophorae]
MSTAATKGRSASPGEAKAKTTLHPVAIADTPAAQAVSIGRPALLLGALYVRLPALINDPVAALNSALPFVVLVQIAYAAICLPIAGAPTQSFLALILTVITVPAVHILFVLFGAPLLDHVARTFLCAAHFSILAAFPMFYTRGVDAQPMLALAGAHAPLDEVSGGVLGAVLGAWLGAVPIPLDWDREWQKWPITIIVGMYLGYAVVSKGVGTLFYGKRLAKSPGEGNE